MKRLLFWVNLLIFCVAFRATERFCHKRTEGFAVSHVLSDVSSGFSSERDEKIDEILKQPFTYLGSGGQTYAFLSQDGKTVLKLFKHHHLRTYSALKALPLPRFLNTLLDDAAKQRSNFFESCLLSFQELREETGVLYLQLAQSNKKWQRKITLIDKLGIKHEIELDQLAFALQKRATLALASVKKMVLEGRKDEAKQAILAIVHVVKARAEKGIRDNDTGLKRNIGLLDNRAVAIDIGAFTKDPALASPENRALELRTKTRSLSLFLAAHDPALWQFYNEALETR